MGGLFFFFFFFFFLLLLLFFKLPFLLFPLYRKSLFIAWKVLFYFFFLFWKFIFSLSCSRNWTKSQLRGRLRCLLIHVISCCRTALLWFKFLATLNFRTPSFAHVSSTFFGTAFLLSPYAFFPYVLVYCHLTDFMSV